MKIRDKSIPVFESFFFGCRNELCKTNIKHVSTTQTFTAFRETKTYANDYPFCWDKKEVCQLVKHFALCIVRSNGSLSFRQRYFRKDESGLSASACCRAMWWSWKLRSWRPNDWYLNTMTESLGGPSEWDEKNILERSQVQNISIIHSNMDLPTFFDYWIDHSTTKHRIKGKTFHFTRKNYGVHW